MMSGASSQGEQFNSDSLAEHPPELALRNISKRFGAIVALDDVGQVALEDPAAGNSAGRPGLAGRCHLVDPHSGVLFRRVRHQTELRPGARLPAIADGAAVASRTADAKRRQEHFGGRL